MAYSAKTQYWKSKYINAVANPTQIFPDGAPVLIHEIMISNTTASVDVVSLIDYASVNRIVFTVDQLGPHQSTLFANLPWRCERGLTVVNGGSHIHLTVWYTEVD